MECQKVLKEVYIGIAIYACIFMVIGVIFIRPAWIYAVALILGSIGACFQIRHIYDTLDRALELDSKNAKSFATVRSLFRLAICMGLMIGGILINWSAFVGVAVGLMGLKVSAFLNPLVGRILNRFDRVENTLDIDKK